MALAGSVGGGGGGGGLQLDRSPEPGVIIHLVSGEIFIGLCCGNDVKGWP